MLHALTQADIPTIVMGDFNDPNMHSAISRVMCANGFYTVAQITNY